MPSLFSNLPKSPGVYIFRDGSGEILYCGKAKSLKDRVASYFNDKLVTSPKTRALVSKIAKIDHIVVPSEMDALILEANLIAKNKPKYNISLKDDKTYPRIEIGLKEKVSQVRLVHHEQNPKAVCFGPYPVGTEATWMLGRLRRVFPFVSQRHFFGSKFQPCFRSHLGLCPCVQINASNEGRRAYRENIRNLIAFLEGRREKIQKTLTRQMETYALKLEFEKAAELKIQLDKIAWMTAPKINPVEYELNPNLNEEITQEELQTLGELIGINSPERIECYDISNTGGALSTGSMVVFTNGSPDKGQYRRFRIKLHYTHDDPRMIEEVILRRFSKRHGWTLPNLVIIDGGVTQLAAARRALASSERKIPTIALAKKLEEIYLDPKNKVQLPLGSPALRLVQKLRNEAHRFSRSYHFLLRSKKMLS